MTAKLDFPRFEEVLARRAQAAAQSWSKAHGRSVAPAIRPAKRLDGVYYVAGIRKTETQLLALIEHWEAPMSVVARTHLVTGLTRSQRRDEVRRKVAADTHKLRRRREALVRSVAALMTSAAPSVHWEPKRLADEVAAAVAPA